MRNTLREPERTYRQEDMPRAAAGRGSGGHDYRRDPGRERLYQESGAVRTAPRRSRRARRRRQQRRAFLATLLVCMLLAGGAYSVWRMAGIPTAEKPQDKAGTDQDAAAPSQPEDQTGEPSKEPSLPVGSVVTAPENPDQTSAPSDPVEVQHPEDPNSGQEPGGEPAGDPAEEPVVEPDGDPPLNCTQEELDAEVQKALSGIITEGMTKLEQAKAVWDFTKGGIRYTGDSDKSDWKSGAYEGLTTRKGDCFTYYAVSRALLTELGIDNLEVQRVGGISSHYWNLVNCGDGWYHFDATPRSSKLPYFVSFMFTDQEAADYTASVGGGREYYTFDGSLYPERATGDPVEEAAG